MSKFIQQHIQNRVLHLMLDRPDYKNALSLEMYSALADGIEHAASDGARVILLYGSGGNFTSGNDLSDFANASVLISQDNPIRRFIKTVLDCELPIVTAIEGVAVGIGTTLLLHTELNYATSDTRFRLPFTKLGLCPEFGSSLLLPQRVGQVKASEWLLTGDFFSAQEACDTGIINGVVEDPLDVAQKQAERLALQAPAALRNTKKLMKMHPPRAVLDDVLEQEFEVFSAALAGPEFAEAAAAFFEKRDADFSSFE